MTTKVSVIEFIFFLRRKDEHHVVVVVGSDDSCGASPHPLMALYFPSRSFPNFNVIRIYLFIYLDISFIIYFMYVNDYLLRCRTGPSVVGRGHAIALALGVAEAVHGGSAALGHHSSLPPAGTHLFPAVRVGLRHCLCLMTVIRRPLSSLSGVLQAASLLDSRLLCGGDRASGDQACSTI